MISAKVICHSTYEGAVPDAELITLEVEFHRFILSEVNTHRVLSRNYQSSRAVPVPKLIEQVRNNPAMPVHWGKNQAGMVANEQMEDYADFGKGEYQWSGAAVHAAERAETLYKQGYHKQIVNRLLEPFMWTRGVITATREGWNSVFALRCHPDAQPEFQALAYKIKEAIENSKPQMLKPGGWHLPYIESFWGRPGSGYGDRQYFPIFLQTKEEKSTRTWNAEYSLPDVIKISTSCCAQVSYRQLDDSLEKAIKIYDMLNLPEGGKFKKDPCHFSPCEHQACVLGDKDRGFFGEGGFGLNGNFGTLGQTKWGQYRKILEKGLEQDFI